MPYSPRRLCSPSPSLCLSGPWLPEKANRRASGNRDSNYCLLNRRIYVIQAIKVLQHDSSFRKSIPRRPKDGKDGGATCWYVTRRSDTLDDH